MKEKDSIHYNGSCNFEGNRFISNVEDFSDEFEDFYIKFLKKEKQNCYVFPMLRIKYGLKEKHS